MAGITRLPYSICICERLVAEVSQITEGAALWPDQYELSARAADQSGEEDEVKHSGVFVPKEAREGAKE